MRHLSVDIESYSGTDLTKSGVYRYVEDPDFQILMCAYRLDDEAVRVVDYMDPSADATELEAMLADPTIQKTAHNAQFEIVCYSEHLRRKGKPVLDPTQWYCSLTHALMLGLPGKLSELCHALHLPDDQQKSMAGRQLLRFFCGPCQPTKTNGNRTRNLPAHDPAKWQLFLDYCKQDVIAEQGATAAMAGVPIDAREMDFFTRHDIKVSQRGVAVDLELVESAIALSELHRERALARSAELTGLANTNSVPQLKRWLEGITGEIVDKLNKETLPKYLQDAPNETVAEVLALRQELAKSSVMKYDALLRSAGADGRVRGLLQFYGASRTGRAAGRIVQVQNLVSNTLPDLEYARALVRQRDDEALALLFGSIPHVLSQCIRTAFIPGPGNKLVVADYSAIEARVAAWLADETWRLEVFRTHGLIYEASASQMFKVPMEDFLEYKRQGKKHPLRKKGKVAELACGFQGGPNALKTMGALKEGLTEEELLPIVKAWRQASPRICRRWYAMNDAAMACVKTGEKQIVSVGPLGANCTITFEMLRNSHQAWLYMTLLSGRPLCYFAPEVVMVTREVEEVGEDGIVRKVKRRKESLSYMGHDQKTGQWTRLLTYGGKLFENCQAEGTLVLTARGWVPIEAIAENDLVHDGVEFVDHGGKVLKSVQGCVKVDGVFMTPDHEVLTNEGWKPALEKPEPFRPDVRNADRLAAVAQRRQEDVLDLQVPVRQRSDESRLGSDERDKARRRVELWMRHATPYRGGEHPSRDVGAPSVRGVALDARSLPTSDAPGLEELRGPRDSGVRQVEDLRELLGRHGADVRSGARARSEEQRRPVCTGELSLGHAARELDEQTQYGSGGRCGGVEQGDGYQQLDAVLSAEPRVGCGGADTGALVFKPVYDILNCGPRQRFVVLGEHGPFVVHNCVQATARDLLYGLLLQLCEKNWPVGMHVHDEIVLDVPVEKAEACMRQLLKWMAVPPAWAPGLPLGGEGELMDYYRKGE